MGCQINHVIGQVKKHSMIYFISIQHVENKSICCLYYGTSFTVLHIIYIHSGIMSKSKSKKSKSKKTLFQVGTIKQ